MSINIERKTLNLKKCSINENISKWIEQDIIVPDTKPDAVKIINVMVTPYVTDTQVLDGKIKVNGKINYFIIYQVSDNLFNNRGLFVSYPYTEVLSVDGLTKNMNVSIRPVTKNVIYSLPNERKISVKSEIMFKLRCHNPLTVNIINRFECDKDVECKMCQSEFNNITNTKTNIITSKEDIMLPKEAEDFFEILRVRVNVVNTEYKESFNKIMVKGDLDLRIIYLSEKKEEPFKTYNTMIPFSSMVELDNIKDKSKFNIEYIVKDFEIRQNPDIVSTKALTAEYEIEVNVLMYEEERVEYVEDFYSQTQNLRYADNNTDIVRKDISLDKQMDIKESLANVLDPNTKILDYDLDLGNVTSTINDSKIVVEGTAKLNMIVQNVDTLDLDTKTVDILIKQEIPIEDLVKLENVYIDMDNKSISVTQNGNDIEVKMNLEIKAIIEDVVNINLIDDITEEKLNTEDLDSMNIYIVKKGDTLWSIAKKYKTSIDKIIKTNENIDKDNISVGKKIFIIR